MLGSEGRNTFIASAERPAKTTSVKMWGGVVRSRNRTSGRAVMAGPYAAGRDCPLHSQRNAASGHAAPGIAPAGRAARFVGRAVDLARHDAAELALGMGRDDTEAPIS